MKAGLAAFRDQGEGVGIGAEEPAALDCRAAFGGSQ